MKNISLLFLLSHTVLLTFGQTRYLDEIFTDVSVTSNITYGNNYNFLLDPQNPFIAPMPMNVYEGNGDTATNRACVVVLHTGDFLPKYFNGSPNGNNLDSSNVEICNQFAKRGYLVVAPNYRLGWDPLNFDADARRGTLVNALYRALHDTKTCVRFMKGEAANYGIDTSKVIVYGEGSGGYVSLAYGSLDRMEELEVQKFTDVSGNLYIDTSLVGQIDGSGGSLNNFQYGQHSNDVLCTVNAGGALLDSAWVEAGEPPIISFHVPTDPFNPFEQGIVIVPTTNENVIDVVGSNWVIRNANLNDNNDALDGPYNDPYSLAGNDALSALGQDPAEYEGLFPFHRVQFPSSYPESSPWEWWDEATVVSTASALGLNGSTIHSNSLLTNPDMSSTKGRLYIDTIMGYLAPRLFEVINGCTPVMINQSHDICYGDSVNINGSVYTETGQYTQNLGGSPGCDSTLVINVQVEPELTIDILGNTNISPSSGEDYAFVNPGGYDISWSVINGTIINGQGTPLATVFWDATGGGEVSLTLSNNDCSHTFILAVGTFVNIENHWINDLQIHPNPSSGIFNIELTEPAQITLMDSRGRKVMESNGNGRFALDLSAHSTGTYTLRLRTEKGVGTKRLVKY